MKNKVNKPCQAIETVKLTKKQLQHPTYYTSGMGVKLTIGDLTLDQCRALLFNTLKEQAQCDKLVGKASALLFDALP